MPKFIFVIGDEALKIKWAKASAAFESKMLAAAEEVAEAAGRAAAMHAPVDTGQLRASIRGHVRRRGGVFLPNTLAPTGTRGHQLDVTIETGVDYGLYVDKGTGIYGPRHRPFQVRKRGGGTYEHPGMEARPFTEPAIRDIREFARERFGRVGHMTVREM